MEINQANNTAAKFYNQSHNFRIYFIEFKESFYKCKIVCECGWKAHTEHQFSQAQAHSQARGMWNYHIEPLKYWGEMVAEDKE